MTHPCFEWINWKVICNTIADSVTQAKATIKDELNVDTADSGSVLQPSPRPLRSRLLRGVCALPREHRAARALPRIMRAAARAGVEDGVDRGDGIATDGGTETVTLRLKDPELQEAVDDAEEEYGNRSEAIRAALRATYTGEGDAPTVTSDGGPTKKAIEAHDWMVEYAGVNGRIGVDTARSMIAQKFQIKAKTIDNLVFRPLKQNGWIAVSQGLHEVAIVVKPRPDADAADAQEVPADD